MRRRRAYNSFDLPGCLVPAAIKILGEPHRQCGSNLRWDNDRVSVTGDKFFDYVDKKGGSVIEFIKRYKPDVDPVELLIAEEIYIEPGKKPKRKASPRKKKAANGSAKNSNGTGPSAKTESKAEHAEDMAEKAVLRTKGDFPRLGWPTKVYEYLESNGLEVCRFEPTPENRLKKKTFRQRHAARDAIGFYDWNIDGCILVPYHCPEVRHAVNKRRWIIFVEGEKDADNCRAGGLTATTVPMGANKWPDGFEEYFRGAHVCLVGDNDTAGQEHVDLVGRKLHGIAAMLVVAVLPDLPPKGDYSDFAAKFTTPKEAADAFLKYLGEAKDWEPRPAGAPDPNWRRRLKLSRFRVPHANVANIMLELENDPVFAGLFYYDAFSQLPMLAKPVPQRVGQGIEPKLPREWQDSDTTTLQAYFQLGDYPKVDRRTIDEALLNVAVRTRSVHPVQDFLNSLQWDGTPRLDDCLVTLCGVSIEDEAHGRYVRAVGAKWMISAVAHVMDPGCQVDHVLVLESPQGFRKSTLFRVLAVRDEWFSDSISPDLGSKDASDHTRGLWIGELAELSQMRKSTLESTKAFISRRVERFRAAYGRHKIVYRRQCVFGASTNSDRYLADSTGNRRFWPVKVGRIDIAAATLNRDQLWAEAVHRYRHGEVWWLDDELLEQIAAQEQAQRYQGDPWEEEIIAFLAMPVTGDKVYINQVLKDAIGLTKEKQGRSDQNRVIDILKTLGWERGRQTNRGTPWVKRRAR